MKANIEWVEKVRFHASSGSGHQVTLDGAAEAGGENAGARPMELLLMGLGGCTAYDVVTILAKSRQTVTSCVAELEATRSEGVPAVFERIHVHFRVKGDNLDEAKVKRAVSLSADKYCSASIMLTRGGVKITHAFTVEQD